MDVEGSVHEKGYNGKEKLKGKKWVNIENKMVNRSDR